MGERKGGINDQWSVNLSIVISRSHPWEKKLAAGRIQSQVSVHPYTCIELKYTFVDRLHRTVDQQDIQSNPFHTNLRHFPGN